jgi:hypothetical protein
MVLSFLYVKSEAAIEIDSQPHEACYHTCEVDFLCLLLPWEDVVLLEEPYPVAGEQGNPHGIDYSLLPVYQLQDEPEPKEEVELDEGGLPDC